MRRAAYVVGAIVASVLAVGACYSPTEIRVVLTSDASCVPPAGQAAPRVGIYVGAPHAVEVDGGQAGSATCTTADGAIGDLVLVPNGDRTAHLDLAVVLRLDGADPDTCASEPTSKQCITARRRASFASHQSLSLPIVLQKSCAGVVCSDPDATCFYGQCRPFDVEREDYCDKEVCPDAGLPVADAGDAGGDGGDASVVDSGSDGGDPDASTTACGWNGSAFAATPAGSYPSGNLLANKTTLLWVSGTQLIAITKDGSPNQRLVRNVSAGAPFAVDDTYVYWRDVGQNLLFRSEIDSGTDATLMLTQLDALAINGTYLFAIGTNQRRFFDLATFQGLSPISSDRPPPNDSPQVAAATPTHFFWIGPSGGGQSTLNRVPITTGMIDAEKVVTPLVHAITVGGGLVYTAGSTIEVYDSALVSGATFAPDADVRYLASSPNDLYWIGTSGGGLPAKYAVYRKAHGSSVGAGKRISKVLDQAFGLVVVGSCVYYWAKDAVGLGMRALPL